NAELLSRGSRCVAIHHLNRLYRIRQPVPESFSQGRAKLFGRGVGRVRQRVSNGIDFLLIAATEDDGYTSGSGRLTQCNGDLTAVRWQAGQIDHKGVRWRFTPGCHKRGAESF